MHIFCESDGIYEIICSGTFAWDFPAMVEVSLSAADAVLLVFSHVSCTCILIRT